MTKMIVCLLVLIGYSLLPQNLMAGDATVYGGFQNPGALTLNNLRLSNDLGAVMGASFSGGRILGFEQSFGFSPNFLESRLNAFNTQTNLVVGIPVGSITP